DLLTKVLSPILTPLHFPTDLVPLALMRPLSGSATLALLTDVVHRFGPDNIISLMAATIYGSTETTFYVVAVYFGSDGIKQARHDCHRRRGDHATLQSLVAFERFSARKNAAAQKTRPLRPALVRFPQNRNTIRHDRKAIQHRAAFGGIGKWRKH